MSSSAVTRAGWLLILFPALAPALLAHAREDERWTVRAQTVYTASGDPIGGGFVLVADGKIAGVGKGGGSGGPVLEVGAVTPGLVDLSPQIDTGNFSVEQSTETASDLRVTDALDLFSHRWTRVLRSGVTSVLVTPEDHDVIGGYAALIKTGGPATLEARLVVADAALRGAIGSQPSSGNSMPRFTSPSTFYFRRPTTRMGVEWVFRKAYYDALEAREDVDPRQARRNEAVQRTLRGEVAVSVQAKATQDVRTAIYLKEEFEIPRMILDQAVEAWREPELLVRSGAAVVLPPFSPSGRTHDGFVNDSYFMPLDAAKRLYDLGVPFALSAHDEDDLGARLADQAALAQRGGLPFDAALAAVTIQPARLVGADARVGSIEVGKDADLVLWSGTPFEPTSRIVGVILGGKLVVDPRPSAR